MAKRARPSVTVRQVISTSPAAVSVDAILPATIIGPCKQVVDPQISSADGSVVLNATARVSAPALLQALEASGDPKVYALTKDWTLCFSVNEKEKVTWTVPATADYTPAAVVNALKTVLKDAGETDAFPQKVGSGTGDAWRLLTVAKSEDQSLRVDPDGPAAPARVTGTVDLTTLTFPGDVTGLTLLVSVQGGAAQTITLGSPVDAAAMATAIAALTGATAGVDADDFLYIETDASGAGQTIEVTGGTLRTVVGLPTGIVTGEGSSTGLLSAFGFSTTSFSIGMSRYAQHEVVLPPSAFPEPRANLDQLVFELDSIRGFFNTQGSTLQEQLRTAAPLQASSNACTVIDDGDGDSKSPILNVSGVNFLNPTATQAVITGAGAPNFASLSNKTLILGDGGPPRLIQFGTVSAIGDVVNTIQAHFDPLDGIEASNSGGNLRLACTRKRRDTGTICKGQDSCVVIYGGTAVNSGTTYLDSGGTPTLVPGRTFGTAYRAAPGDAVYVEGVFQGYVTKVAPGGVTTRLKLDREMNLSFTGMSFHIVARGLGDDDITRPQPALIVQDDGTMVLKPALLRDSDGRVSEAVVSDTLVNGKAYLYVGYTALRLDVSSKAAGILKLGSTADVESLLSPIDERNPLGMAAYMALRGSSRFPIHALGVDEVSTDDPMGTPAAYGRVATKLEGVETYAIAGLSPSLEVADIFQSHVNTLSAASGKRERLYLFAPSEPTEKLSTLVASGEEGNTMGVSPFETFDTGIADLSVLLKEAGITDPSSISVDDGVYLEIEGETARYNISSVSGSTVTLTTTFSPGENDDDYYSADFIAETYIDQAFAVRIRGTSLTNLEGEVDLDAMAETMAAIAASYADRRVWVLGPDTSEFIVNGSEKSLPTGYACAVIAAMIGQLPVSQSFTNLPMPVISSVRRMSGRYNEEQMSTMAGGGMYLLVQDGAGLPVVAREAITSDVTSDETAMDIQLKEVDLFAKLVRLTIKPKLGVTNLTKEVADDISALIEGARDTLVSKGLLEDFTLTSVARSETSNARLAIAGNIKAHYALLGADVTIYI